MTDRPIIFSGPMVNALLAGCKTQTRRVLCQFDPERDPPHAGPYIAGHKAATWTDSEGTPWRYPGAKGAATGDRLYVREHWRTAPAYDDLSPSEMGGEEPVKYEADGDEQMWGWPERFIPGRFRQGRHMPRWASRLTLTVTDVRVQRLQDISAADTIAEGVQCDTCNAMAASACHGRGCFASAAAFQSLWNSLHGADAWDANPFVCAISFAVQKGNIDDL